MTGPPRDPRNPPAPKGGRDGPEPGNGGRGSLEGPPNGEAFGGRGSLEGPPPEPREPRRQPERPGQRARRTAKPAGADATAEVPAVTADGDATATTPVGNGGNGNGRAGRRQRSKRRKKRILAGVGALAILAGAGGAFAMLSGGETQVKAAPPKRTTTTTTTTTLPPLPPASVTATSTIPKINAYDAPADTAKVVSSFTDTTEYLQPRTFLVTDKDTSPGWLQVLLPQRPNNTSAWIKASEVTLGETRFSIKIELGAYMVTLYKDGAVVLQTQAVVGKQQTPTPLGKFYITDPVDLQTRPNGAYGAYALGLSGYSEVLMSFNGGPGQIAVHGTSNPEQVGQNLSNGCIRIPNDIVLQIVGQQVPLGTPVEIVA